MILLILEKRTKIEREPSNFEPRLVIKSKEKREEWVVSELSAITPKSKRESKILII